MINYIFMLVIKLSPLPVKRFLVRFYWKIVSVLNILGGKVVFFGLAAKKLEAAAVHYSPNNRFDEVVREPTLLNKELGSHVGNVKIVDLKHFYSLKENVLIFVERSAENNFSYQKLAYLSTFKNYHIIFRSKKDYLEFFDFFVMEYGQVHFSSSRVLYIPTIDPSLDELVYSQSDDLSQKFLDALERTLSDRPEFNKFSKYINSLQVGISDRLVSWVRVSQFVLKFIEENAIQEFYVFGNRVIDSNLLAFLAQSNNEVTCGFLKNVTSKKLKKLSSVKVEYVISRNWSHSDRLTTTKYHIEGRCNLDEDVLMFIGNLSDPMYRETLQPVLNYFSQKNDKKILTLLLNSEDFRNSVDAGKKVHNYIFPSIEREDMPSINEFNHCFDDAIDELLLSEFSHCSNSGLLALYVFLNSRNALHRVIRDCYGLMIELDKVTSKSSLVALVSNPGRIWPSQFMVGYLNNTPSFDIQSGTFSRSARFKKPGSQYVLSVDDFSKSVYVDYLGVDSSNVEVVGAPRIDARLANIREYSQEKSRDTIAVCEPSFNILCLATQPYDIGLMTSMVREACHFIKSNDDWFLLVSMHPNESNAFESSYKEVLYALNCSSRAIISRDNIYHNLNASDAVATFFSTAGLEAFCLNKPVLAYRPLSYPVVPFDLCALGVARSFVNSLDLYNLLNSTHYFGVQSEGLKRLRDSGSVERIYNFVMDHIGD
ncbi:hypothetical protein [Halomonas sp. CSM-2]|uniref:hypothetical protein n=1 Tax=Halomonas sp. CSM-2 TaxID=1975722 RepID=UPI00111C92B5|nr:hypothetical protein [Halomonas sp. CSM-2]